MTPQQLVGLALRLTSVWLVLLAVQLYSLTTAAFDYIKEGVPVTWIAIAVSPALLAIGLWMFPMLLAQRLLPRPPATSAGHPPIQEAAAAAFIVLGILAMLKAVPIVFAGVNIAIVGRDMDLANYYFQGERGVMFIASIVQYAVGLCLLTMPRLIARRVFALPSHSTERKPA